MIVSKKRITDIRKRTKNTGSMRANQESWFWSGQGERERERERVCVCVCVRVCACDLGLAKKRKKQRESQQSGYDPRLASQRFELFLNCDADPVKDSARDSPSPLIFASQSFVIGDVNDVFSTQTERRLRLHHRSIAEDSLISRQSRTERTLMEVLADRTTRSCLGQRRCSRRRALP